jgi:prepilin-type N-terminal cleavage/methylation domain-containing protein
MFIKFGRKHKRGFTAIEMLVATGLFGIATATVCTIYMVATRGFASLANYAELDKINRNAMDNLTMEIRQAKLVTDVQSNSFSLINGDNVSVTYWFNPTAKQFIRSASDGSSKVLISSCALINFEVFQRNNIAGTWDQYPIATNNWSEYVKVIQLTWKAARAIPGGPGVSENVQTAKIVIRKQH